MIDRAIPDLVTSTLRDSFGVHSAQRVAPGLSGAILFRCEADSKKQYALRRWPKNTSVKRISHVHHVMKAARGNGCDVVPRLFRLAKHPGNQTQTVAYEAGHHWELAEWMPGEPIACNVPLDAIETGARAIACFHRSVRSLGTSVQSAPAIRIRQSRLIELEDRLPETLRANADAFSPVVRSALNLANEILRAKWASVRSEISRSLERYAATPVLTQCVIRDVHREHILFANSDVTGLIDFDAVRVDTPLTDLARWAGGLMVDRENPQSVWTSALAGYHQATTFSQRDAAGSLELLNVIFYSSAWITLANWSVWLGLEKRQFPCDDQIIANRVQLAAKQAAVAEILTL